MIIAQSGPVILSPATIFGKKRLIQSRADAIRAGRTPSAPTAETSIPYLYRGADYQGHVAPTAEAPISYLYRGADYQGHVVAEDGVVCNEDNDAVPLPHLRQRDQPRRKPARLSLRQPGGRRPPLLSEKN